jgi:hypothetical protein
VDCDIYPKQPGGRHGAGVGLILGLIILILVPLIPFTARCRSAAAGCDAGYGDGRRRLAVLLR